MTEHDTSQNRFAALQALAVDQGKLREDLEAVRALLAQDRAERQQLASEVSALRERLAAEDDEGEAPGYRPVPAPRWWAMPAEDRDREIQRLEWWVREVFRPGYGYLAAGLGACWPRHDLALYVLDVLSELHMVLYGQPKRPVGLLSSAAEWHARLLPALADILTRETTQCDHVPGGAS